ncbi:MAG: hypothetical protein WD558_07375 [Pseudomonadales bacterium]
MAFVSRRLIFLLALVSTFAIHADETISLAEYLTRANDAGLQVLFSTDAVSSQYSVTFDPELEITLAKVKHALAAFNLTLRLAAPNVWVVERKAIPPMAPVAPVEPGFNAPRPRLEELIVTSSRYRLLMRDQTRSSLLARDDLSLRPATGNDAIRIVNQLPGSASVGVSAKPRVRGGNEDETLILFDGIRLYEPFHFARFSSLFSGFDARVIDSVDFYSGGFPVELGDRLSAAMVIEPLQLSDEARIAGFGVLNASYFQSRPGAHKRWLVSARQSTLNLFTRLASHNPGSPGFADFFGRYEFEPGDGDTLSLNLLWFGDDIEINNSTGSEIATSHTSNTYLWLKWSHSWSESTYMDTWFSVGGVNDDRQGVVDKSGQVIGALDDRSELTVYNIKQALEALPADWMHLKVGWDYRYVNAAYDYTATRAVDPAFAMLGNTGALAAQSINLLKRGHQGAIYTNLRLRLMSTATIETGVRFDLQHYEHDIHASQLSPRINLLYEPGQRTQLRIGWGEFTQAEGLHELKVSDGIETFQLPQKAEHAIAGVRYIFDTGVEVRLDLYRKRGTDANDYFENLTNPLSLLPELQVDRVRISPQSFVAKGVEISATGQLADYEWWANYSYATVKDTVDGIEVYRSWDQTRSANLGALKRFGQWDVAVTASYHNGWLTTPLTYDGSSVSAPDRNSQRFGNYGSLDIKLSRTWQVGNDEIQLDLGATNLLNRDNTIGFEYQLVNNALVARPRYGPTILPFAEIFWQF